MGIVSCVKVSDNSTNPEVVFKAVKKAMELASWEGHVKGKNIILKVNVMWDKLYPSCTTSPMVIEGVIRVLRSSNKFKDAKITIVDANTPSFSDVGRAFRTEGIEKMAQKYGIDCINLSKTEFETVYLKKFFVLSKLQISKVLLAADTIISIPVPKTHTYSTITGALKNQWGCIYDLRHNYHMVVHKAIADVNRYLKNKVTFAVVDALFGMEGKGPKNGTPKKLGYLFASHDLVSLDRILCQAIGVDYKEIGYVNYSSQAGVGSLNARLVGDSIPAFNFIFGLPSNISMGMEMRIRKMSPFLAKLCFSPTSPLLLVLRIIAKIYYDLWYAFLANKNVHKMMGTNFGKMWKSYLK
ncbi:hypothetical protein A2617_02880 [Candidatus Daviesbacteria bacterium RIFOXYD1_FULL_41_10]|uniref:DUF362 domain-containing protein n=2 Tax=Candidatus Daviesiibacteriota TaxID=1752718 RepID=A0A1F5N3E8_9BACT|nr:MAG: hypothetical protein UU67_C0071G0014 [Candidatus Daviesbacteria bacterium GW2011_GWB1_41_5]OGE72082.1 MAG: hypothetical protein A2617_02880 [Candidatus Daviesbacteria bacterium RIFOXYD1_FULL_41_10]